MTSNLFKPFCDKLMPADILAVIILVGGLALKFTGADGVVGTILVVVTGYYFGKQYRIKTKENV